MRRNSSWLPNGRDLPTTATGESQSISTVNWDYPILDMEVSYIFNIIFIYLISYLFITSDFTPYSWLSVTLHLDVKHQHSRMRTLLSTPPMAEISWRQRKEQPCFSGAGLRCLCLAPTADRCAPLRTGQRFRPIQFTTDASSAGALQERGIFN